MTIHPEHAIALAADRHRELVAAAAEHRLATAHRPAAGAGAAVDCRVPPGAGLRQPCRPDPRPTPASGERSSRTPASGEQNPGRGPAGTHHHPSPLVHRRRHRVRRWSHR